MIEIEINECEKCGSKVLIHEDCVDAKVTCLLCDHVQQKYREPKEIKKKCIECGETYKIKEVEENIYEYDNGYCPSCNNARDEREYYSKQGNLDAYNITRNDLDEFYGYNDY